MTRLEYLRMLADATALRASVTRDDLAALVAVAREAQNVCEVYARSDERKPSIECLIDALAPLLESTGPRQREGL
jgi:hypothetical protein